MVHTASLEVSAGGSSGGLGGQGRVSDCILGVARLGSRWRVCGGIH